jgi:hypothetical protein
MPKPNPALFDPLRRLEEASRRCAGLILTGKERPLQDHPMIQTEIKEMERAIADFKAAVERGETAGPVDHGLTKRDGD